MGFTLPVQEGEGGATVSESSEKRSRLQRAVRIFRLLWQERRFRFDGEVDIEYLDTNKSVIRGGGAGHVVISHTCSLVRWRKCVKTSLIINIPFSLSTKHGFAV